MLIIKVYVYDRRNSGKKLRSFCASNDRAILEFVQSAGYDEGNVDIQISGAMKRVADPDEKFSDYGIDDGCILQIVD